MTKESSLVMAKNLVRITMSNICYFRQLFPESYFVDRSIPELGISVKKLQYSMGKESDKVILWVDEGVTDALTKSYLKSMSFLICAGSQDKVLEEYKFSFQYGAGGEIKSLTMHSREPTFHLSCVGSIRQKVAKLVRLLIALTTTLDDLPNSRRVFVRLSYHDHTPDEYEPPHFQSSTGQKFMPFATTGEKALVINLGSVETEFHQVSLHVRSALNNQLNDDCNEESEQLDKEDEDKSDLNTIFTCSEEEGKEEGEEEEESPRKPSKAAEQVMAMAPLGLKHASQGTAVPNSHRDHGRLSPKKIPSPSEENIEEQVLEWCSSRGQFDRYELRRAFPHIPNSKLDDVAKTMVAQKHKWQAFGNGNVFAKGGSSDHPSRPGNTLELNEVSGCPEKGRNNVKDTTAARCSKGEGVGTKERLSGASGAGREDAYHKCVKLFKNNKEFQVSELEEALGLSSQEAMVLVERLVEEEIMSPPLHLRRRTIYTVKNPPSKPEDVSIQLAKMMEKVCIDSIPDKRIPRKALSKQIEFEHDPDYQHLVGKGIGIYWSMDNKWYNAIVMKAAAGKCKVKYDDGEVENLELKNEHYRWLPDAPENEDVFGSQRASQSKNRKASQCQSPIHQLCFKKIKREK
eukprot:scaffold1368_cov333-Pavlova_lutheri.AAC.15